MDFSRALVGFSLNKLGDKKMSFQSLFRQMSFVVALGVYLLMFGFAAAENNNPKLFILGDSLVAGYGLEDLNNSFPNQLAQKFNDLNINIEVMGAGVSGDTSTAANERLLWALGDAKADQVKYALIELGANDAFRGIAPKETKAALQQIIDKLKAQNVKILLAGMLAPPNMGREYEESFAKLFTQLVKENNIAFYPFFLDGVAGNMKLNQPDGIHPTKEGVAVVVKNIMPSILELLKNEKGN